MPGYKDWPREKRRAYQRGWYLAHKQHNITTYAEQTRICRVCNDEFKIHYHNRFRETCGDECHRELMRQLAKANPTNLQSLAAGRKINHIPRYKGARYGDYRDEKILMEQLFIMTFRPCEDCGGEKFIKRTAYAGHQKNLYQMYCGNRKCRKHRSPRTGTIFEKSYTPITIWLAIIRRYQRAIRTNPDHRTSLVRFVDIAHDFGIGKNSALRILKRVKALPEDSPYIFWAMHPEMPPRKGVLVKDIDR